jgi:hypothetical protein
MQLLLAVRFRRAYAALPPDEQKQVQKALRKMSEDLRYRPVSA